VDATAAMSLACLVPCCVRYVVKIATTRDPKTNVVELISEAAFSIRWLLTTATARACASCQSSLRRPQVFLGKASAGRGRLRRRDNKDRHVGLDAIAAGRSFLKEPEECFLSVCP
jgi:hypothetical protein